MKKIRSQEVVGISMVKLKAARRIIKKVNKLEDELIKKTGMNFIQLQTFFDNFSKK